MFLHPERYLAGFRPPLLAHRFMFFCAQLGILRQMVWALGDLLDLLAAALANAGVGGSAGSPSDALHSLV